MVLRLRLRSRLDITAQAPKIDQPEFGQRSQNAFANFELNQKIIKRSASAAVLQRRLRPRLAITAQAPTPRPRPTSLNLATDLKMLS